MQLSRSRGKIGQGVPSSRARRTATHRPRRASQSASASRLSTLFFGSFHIRTGPGADRQAPPTYAGAAAPLIGLVTLQAATGRLSPFTSRFPSLRASAILLTGFRGCAVGPVDSQGSITVQVDASRRFSFSNAWRRSVCRTFQVPTIEGTVLLRRHTRRLAADPGAAGQSLPRRLGSEAASTRVTRRVPSNV